MRCGFAWGPETGELLGAHEPSGVVVVDVLSFSTTVTIATERGISLIPAAPEDAAEVASLNRALLAARTRQAGWRSPYSLSPSVMAEAPPGGTVVVASPNGSAISALCAKAGVLVVAASLRNVSAVASWLKGGLPGGPLVVVAAGEQNGDGAFRYAAEDLFGAGLLLSQLEAEGLDLDGEAASIARLGDGLEEETLSQIVEGSDSGRELCERGFSADVTLAVALDSSSVVPVVVPSEAAFKGASSGG